MNFLSLRPGPAGLAALLQPLTLEDEAQRQSKSHQHKHGGGRNHRRAPAAAWRPQPCSTLPEQAPAGIFRTSTDTAG